MTAATVGEAIRAGETALPSSTTPRLDAQLLVGHVLERDRAWVIAHPEASLEGFQLQQVADLVERRRRGIPIAYLRGRVEWFGVDLEVTPDVLVPRPDTEILAETAVEIAGSIDAHTIVDLGTGSGSIALALAKCVPRSEVIATDVSGAALRVAERNVERYGLSDRIRLVRGDLLDVLFTDVDLIVANLPYLSEVRMATLSRDVQSEPVLALAGGADGLDIYRRLAAQMVERALRVPVVIEIDPEQTGRAIELFSMTHSDVRTVRDLAGRTRVLVATP